MARTGSKRQVAMDIMAANVGKSMTDVLPMIADANNITVAAARSYYVWIVKNTDIPGVIEVKTRAPKAREPKAVKTKAAAVAKIKSDKKPVETKSPAEIDKIKAANLARIKAVAKKFNANKPEAEVVNQEEHDPFASPAFLTKDEVTALV